MSRMGLKSKNNMGRNGQAKKIEIREVVQVWSFAGQAMESINGWVLLMMGGGFHLGLMK
jgi:hypothetical protein